MSQLNQRTKNVPSSTETGSDSDILPADKSQEIDSCSTPVNSPDAGNQSSEYYRSKLSPLRFKLRSLCLPYIRTEHKLLHKIQMTVRNPVFDFYFAWTANLASHTFYVLMLPLPLWFGYNSITTDLVFVLGFGIFITGTSKDYLCLPRPQSPPLHRITMSGYTTKEYGWPSSHSANATSVTLLFAIRAITSLKGTTLVVTLLSLFIYYFSLIFGRIYCGMHGFFDILAGSAIGVVVTVSSYVVRGPFEKYILNGGLISPILIVVFYGTLIHFHSQPADDCPCFDDSVAFIGVLAGIDLSEWIFFFSGLNQTRTLMISFEYSQLGLTKTILRALTGVILVVIWKAVSKPFFLLILTPIYKKFGLYIPRNFYKSAADENVSTSAIIESSHNIEEPVADVQSFIQSIVEHHPHDDKAKEDVLDPSLSCGALKPRYDVEVVARLLVYAGVPLTAIWVFTYVADVLNLSCQ